MVFSQIFKKKSYFIHSPLEPFDFYESNMIFPQSNNYVKSGDSYPVRGGERATLKVTEQFWYKNSLKTLKEKPQAQYPFKNWFY